MRIKIRELLEKTGSDRMALARALWPDANDQTRRVLMANWEAGKVVSIRLDQLQILRDFFLTTNIDNLIDFT